MKLDNKLEKEIKDFDTNSLITISLWDDTTLQEIAAKSGELAEKNEFQVHYWALNLIKTFSDDSKICISIPLVFYNYKQEVSAASIDFELKDVEEMSDKTQELAISLGNNLYNKIKHQFKDYKPYITPLNSVHRHP